MPRALFEKTGNAVYISHLDLMRVFQRAFKRAGLPLTHTKGFNPRPSVSIALPLSLGIQSVCELLDFELEGEPVKNEVICTKLNDMLIDGVRVVSVYDDAAKIRHLAFLDCTLSLEYDGGIPENASDDIASLFHQKELWMEKKSKNGAVQQQNIISLIRNLQVKPEGDHEVIIHARIYCQNPTLNPMQLVAAIEAYLPHLRPNFVRCCREEVYDQNEIVFR